MTKRFTLVLIALVALAMLILPASAAKNVIAAGGDVFIGEQGLDVSAGVGSATNVAWYATGSNPSTDTPNSIVPVGNAAQFYVAPASFVGRTGVWYQWNGAAPAGAAAFTVVDPSLDIKVWSNTANKDVTGKSVTSGEFVNFRVETNTYSVATRPTFNPATDGFVTIKVKTADGATYTALWESTTVAIPLTNRVVDSSLWTWVAIAPTTGWNTGVVDTAGSKLYKAGTYTVSAELNLNSIKDNYRAPDGGDYTGKTVTALKTVTIAGDTVKIEASKDTVVRGNQFSVTVTGRPNEYYYVWVKGTSSMTDPTKQPPQILLAQDSVFMDPPCGIGWWVSTGMPNPIGAYQFEGGAGKTIALDVPPTTTPPPCSYYCGIKTSASGTRTVGFVTGGSTDDKKYTIRVERNFGTLSVPNFKSDEVDVKVEKGTVTVVAAGDGSYFLGQEVLLSGTNSETDNVYLFITGPNLPSDGGLMTNPRQPVQTIVAPFAITSTDVNEDNTWEYKWQTANLNIDAGSYTIYAVATPSNRAQLADTKYGTVSVIIRKPFVTAQVSPSVVAQGDSVHFRGVAEGQPSPGVAIWTMGKNYAERQTESVNDDGTFDYEISGAVTSTMTSGQYFSVIQHPMYNDEFDVIYNTGTGFVQGAYPVRWSNLFKLSGSGSLQGSDAANALTEELDNPDIDDTYTKLQFLVEVPEIKIVPITDKLVGDQFEVRGTTNLAVDDELLVEVYSSSFFPTEKEFIQGFSGTTGTVKVVRGTEGFNTWAFPVDTTTFKPDEYIVSVSAIGLQSAQDVTATTLFTVVEFLPVTVPPTMILTMANTTVPTTSPTPVPTAAPGFGVLIALLGICAGAFLILRKG